MATTSLPEAVPAAGAKLEGSRTGDRLFRAVLILAALAIPVLMGFLVAELYTGARLAIDKFGLHFVTGSVWDPVAEKFGAFLPAEHYKRTATMNWLMWQMGAAPFVGGGFGHFYAYAPFKIEYAINRYAMETKRQLHVLDTHLAKNEYMAGDQYTIADMAIWPWYGSIMRNAYGAQEFLAVDEYKSVNRWVELIASRPAVKRGQIVNRTFGPPETQVPERHAATDIDKALGI